MAFRRSVNQAPSRGRVSVKRKSLWLPFEPVDLNITATGGTITNALNAAALALRPFTIVRSIFNLYIRSDQEAAAEFQDAAFGLAVVSDQSSAIGVTAVPTPDTDAGSSLFWLHSWLKSSSSSGTGSAVSGRGIVVDSRAMRKVELGQDMIAVVELTGVSNGFRFASSGRILIKTN